MLSFMGCVLHSNKVVKIFPFNSTNSHSGLQEGWNHKKGKTHLKLGFAGNFCIVL